MGWLADETGLERNAANFVALTPLSHLRRAADLFATREALVYGNQRWTYAQYHERATKLASGLALLGVRPGDVVATLLPNVPAHAEAHFGVPACGAILNAINTRLELDTVAYILEHGGAKVALVDSAMNAIQLVASDCSSRHPGGTSRERSKSEMLSIPRKPPSKRFDPSESLRLSHQPKLNISLVKIRPCP